MQPRNCARAAQHRWRARGAPWPCAHRIGSHQSSARNYFILVGLAAPESRAALRRGRADPPAPSLLLSKQICLLTARALYGVFHYVSRRRNQISPPARWLLMEAAHEQVRADFACRHFCIVKFGISDTFPKILTLFRATSSTTWSKRFFVAKDGFLLYYSTGSPTQTFFDTKPKV